MPHTLLSQIPPLTDPAMLMLLGVLALAAVACGLLVMRLRQSVQTSNRRRDRLVKTLMSRRDELEATLSCMVEGVLAVDMEQRLISINDAAADLLSIRPDRATGRSIDEVIPSHALRRFILATLQETEPIQADLELAPEDDVDADHETARLFQVQGAVLKGSDGRRIGSLLVMHDVTRLRRLEVVRRDFVANASHEIKTPVTAIKAAAETLADGGADDPQLARQFLSIITRQSDRLQAIIEDLLSLARIEQAAERNRVALEPASVDDVLRAAAETCAARAAERHTQLVAGCSPPLTAHINPALLEQALVNLIDNAIKYSPDHSVVKTTAQRLGREIVISVHDRGSGIAPEHLPRIFERFYRTDKARSRALGGTGLGLSIVKHITLAHGGRVSVDSTPGHGSTFRIHLPLT